MHYIISFCIKVLQCEYYHKSLHYLSTFHHIGKTIHVPNVPAFRDDIPTVLVALIRTEGSTTKSKSSEDSNIDENSAKSESSVLSDIEYDPLSKTLETLPDIDTLEPETANTNTNDDASELKGVFPIAYTATVTKLDQQTVEIKLQEQVRIRKVFHVNNKVPFAAYEPIVKDGGEPTSTNFETFDLVYSPTDGSFVKVVESTVSTLPTKHFDMNTIINKMN